MHYHRDGFLLPQEWREVGIPGMDSRLRGNDDDGAMTGKNGVD